MLLCPAKPACSSAAGSCLMIWRSAGSAIPGWLNWRPRCCLSSRSQPRQCRSIQSCRHGCPSEGQGHQPAGLPRAPPFCWSRPPGAGPPWQAGEKAPLPAGLAAPQAGSQAAGPAPRHRLGALSRQGLRPLPRRACGPPPGFPLPSGGIQSMLDHSPANALGGLASAKQIAGRRADLEGTEATHQMHRGSWPAQV